MVDDARLDAYVSEVLDGIARHGWMIQGVFGTQDDPTTFSYTVGLTARDKPELFLDTLTPQQAGSILNAVAKRVLAGALNPRADDTFDAEFSCPFKWRGPIDVEAAECNMALNIFSGVTAFQVLWPDTAGLFPTDDGYNFQRFPQRLMPLEKA